MGLKTQEFFDPATSTLTYVIWDEVSKDAIVIDPVLDYDPLSSKLTSTSLRKLLSFLSDSELKLRMLLETHAHADHVSAADALKQIYPDVSTAVGAGIVKVQETFGKIYDFGGMRCDGSQFDRLLQDGETMQAGSLRFQVLAVPGHTPACIAFLFDGMVFTGDCIFMPDGGTGRCDFPGGSAEQLFDSIVGNLYRLPDETRMFVGHDYQPGGRALRFETSIGEQKAANIHLKAETERDAFIQFRTARDATLSPPKLIHPSLQINLRGGKLPELDRDGRRFLQIPLQVEMDGLP